MNCYEKSTSYCLNIHLTNFSPTGQTHSMHSGTGKPGTTEKAPIDTDQELSAHELDKMLGNARDATDFLKALAHEGRLIILCRLSRGECPVSELENMLSARQAAVSQQLARLRLEGLVTTRREGKTIYYAIKDERVKKMIEVVYDLFCH